MRRTLQNENKNESNGLPSGRDDKQRVSMS